MFRRIEGSATAARDDGRPEVALQVDGRTIAGRAGEPLALTLLNAGIEAFRTTPVSGAPRAPLCLMGVCFDCLVEVDGRRNVRACAVETRAGLQVRLPVGAPRVDAAPAPETAR